MAPIYLAQKTQTANAGPNVFGTRGIKGYAPSTISSLSIVGLPKVKELAYDGYYRNIDAFMHATNVREKVFCDLRGYTNAFRATSPIKIAAPDVAFVSGFPLKPSDEDGMAKKIKSFAVERIGKTVVFKLQNPGPMTLANLINMSDPNFTCGPDAVTPTGYKAFLFIRDCISEFLATHSYSAFTNYNFNEEGPQEMLALKNSKRTVPIGTFVMTSKRNRNAYLSPAYRYTLEENEEEPEDPAELEKWLDSKDPGHHGVAITNTAGVVLRAKPSPNKTENNVGPASALPNMPGLAFPYFPGMNTPDSLLLKTMVSQHFIRLLGRDSAEVSAAYVKIRRGLNSLSTTTAGKTLGHMLAGVKLALDTQARLFLIMDSEYRGFCLLGMGFTVIDGGAVYESLTNEKLQEDLRSFNTHAKGLAEVLESLNSLSMTELSNEGNLLEEKDIETAEKLVLALAKLNVNEESESFRGWEKKINNSLRLLQFFPSTLYDQIHPDSVVDLCSRITAFVPKKKLPSTPFKFTTWNAPYGNVLYRCLAAFGVEAPSPWNNSGSEILIQAQGKASRVDEEGRAQKKVKTDEIYENMPQFLIFSPKPVYIAFKDWTTVIKKGAVKMDAKERAKGYRCMNIADEDKRKAVWKGLVNMQQVVGSTETPSEDKGKGRAPADVPFKSYEEIASSSTIVWD